MSDIIDRIVPPRDYSDESVVLTTAGTLRRAVAEIKKLRQAALFDAINTLPDKDATIAKLEAEITALRAEIERLKDIVEQSRDLINAAELTRDEENLVLALTARDTRIEAFRAENEKLRAALVEIKDRHIPDQPSALDIDEATYITRQYAELRRIARAALEKGPEA